MNLDWSVVWRNAGALVEGTELTVALAVLTMAIAVPGGIVLALMRLSRSRLLSRRKRQLRRAVPQPAADSGDLHGVLCDADFPGPAVFTVRDRADCLALNVSAYNGETFRAGIGSIRKGQSEAAYALGMTRWQAMRQVVLPQAARRVLPVLASTWVSLFKDTSLVSVIAVGELAYTAMRIRSQTFRVLEMLTAMAAIYWVLGYPQAKLIDWLDRRLGVSE